MAIVMVARLKSHIFQGVTAQGADDVRQLSYRGERGAHVDDVLRHKPVSLDPPAGDLLGQHSNPADLHEVVEVIVALPITRNAFRREQRDALIARGHRDPGDVNAGRVISDREVVDPRPLVGPRGAAVVFAESDDDGARGWPAGCLPR